MATAPALQDMRDTDVAPPAHLVDLTGRDRDWVLGLFARAEELRVARRTLKTPRPLAGRTAALVFHKPSLRTRVSFTVGMHELGGDAVDLSAAEVSENGGAEAPQNGGAEAPQNRGAETPHNGGTDDC